MTRQRAWDLQLDADEEVILVASGPNDPSEAPGITLDITRSD